MADHGHHTTTRSSGPGAVPSCARCLDCKYSLVGLAENVCPECGRGFDPSDPRTYLGELPRWLTSGGREVSRLWVSFVLFLVIVAIAADTYSMGLNDVVRLVIACVSIPTFGIACIRAACGREVLVEREQPSEVIRSMVWRRIRAPLIAVALTILLGFHAGAWVRLVVSLPWIIPAAREVAAAGPGTCDGRSRQLGLFRVASVNYWGIDEWDRGNRSGAIVFVYIDQHLLAIRCNDAGVPISW